MLVLDGSVVRYGVVWYGVVVRRFDDDVRDTYLLTHSLPSKPRRERVLKGAIFANTISRHLIGLDRNRIRLRHAREGQKML